MEHESFVPIPPTRLTQALRTTAVLAASLPGWQPDGGDGIDGAAGAGAAPMTGRLRLRIGGSTITYRGTVRVTGEGPTFTLMAEGTEVRGTGTVQATASVGVAATERPEPGSLLVWRGSAQTDGRLAGYEKAVVEAAVRRLLDRFAAELAAHAPEMDMEAEAAAESPADALVEAEAELAAEAEAEVAAEVAAELAAEAVTEAVTEAASEAVTDAASEAVTEAASEAERDAEREAAAEAEEDAVARAEDEAAASGAVPAAQPAGQAEEDAEAEGEEEPDVVDDLGGPLPPTELEEFELVEVEVEVPESAAALDDLAPPAEAAHARRTMIGRSAEEVDHAPPRGRYAPVPAPDAATTAATLRWAAPAAAALLASAVVVGRVLRRRR
ncbi:CoxG family protein [Streptomyces polygonati]|uniref:CoxG family protein n=1 Tax=Streptomyces polygonati TaxID=1617087 RepID=A0ABV8HR50_9ACTN